MSAQYQPPNHAQAQLISRIIKYFLQLQEENRLPADCEPLTPDEVAMAQRASFHLDLIHTNEPHASTAL